MAELIGSLLILLGAVFHFFRRASACCGCPTPIPACRPAPRPRRSATRWCSAGIAFYHPDWSLKLLIVIYFVLMTNPISSHALARAAHAIRIPMTPRTTRRRARAMPGADREAAP